MPTVAEARPLWEPAAPYLDTASYGLPPRPDYDPALRLAGDTRRLDLSPAWFSWVGAEPALLHAWRAAARETRPPLDGGR